jgi:hypothetical protein
MSELSSEIDRLLSLSVPEVAPPSLSCARVLDLISVLTPVKDGNAEISLVTATTAMDIPPASVPVEIGITDESHAACSIIVVDLSEESKTLVGKSVTLASPMA